MSECVVRMEMPQHCGECNLYVDGWCYALTPDSPQEKEWYASHKERPPMCPILCQLPEGHGRLVDADTLIELMLERKQPLVGADNSKDRYRYMQWLADFNAIRDAKTIVPAEKEGTLNDDY